MSTTKERLLTYLNFKGINKSTFYNQTNISRGFLSNNRLQSSISDSNMTSIIEVYKDINLSWLFTGEGKMYQEKGTEQSYQRITGDHGINIHGSNARIKLVAAVPSSSKSTRQNLLEDALSIKEQQLILENKDLHDQIKKLNSRVEILLDYASKLKKEA